MNLQHGLAPVDVGLVHQDLAVEPSRTQRRRVEDLRPVGRAHDDHGLLRIKTVHLGQQLVQGLFALLVAAHRALHARLAKRIELVDEDDARRLGFGLLEQVAHACGPDADEHLDELGSAETEEGHLGLARHGARQQRLARARRAHQQHALGNVPAQRRVLLRVLQELDDLPQLVFGLVHARHVGKAHLDVVVGVDLRAAAGKRHHAAFGSAHAPEEETPQRHQQQQRDDPAEDFGQPAADDLAVVLDLVRFEVLNEFRVLDARRHEGVRPLSAFASGFLELAADDLIADRDLDDLVRAQQGLELAVGDRASAGAEKPGLRHREQQQQAEHVPDGERRPLRRQRPAFAGFALATRRRGGFGQERSC